MTTAYTHNGVHTYIVRYDDKTYQRARKRVMGWYLMGYITPRQCVALQNAMRDHREAK